MEHLRQKFLKECEVNLRLILNGLETAAAERMRSVALRDVFRGAHSIKGGSGFFELERLGWLAGAIESVCANLMSGALAFSADVACELAKAAQCLDDCTEAAQAGIELVEGYELAIGHRLLGMIGVGQAMPAAGHGMFRYAEPAPYQPMRPGVM